MRIAVHHLSFQTDPEACLPVMLPTSESAERARLAAELFARGLYRHVATVEAPDLAAAFRSTNSVDRPWALEPAAGVEIVTIPHLLGEEPAVGHRSTSMGDVLVLEETGRAHVVDTVGFVELPRPG